MDFSRISRGLACAAAAAAVASQVPAAAEDFYAGKTVTIVTSMGAGGTYDLTASMIARTMPQYIPGTPGMIVKNMPGAGNVLATNYMYNIAPKDGTAIAVVNNAIPLNQILENKGVRYDATKFTWLGSPVTGTNAVIVMASSGVKTARDLFEKEVIMGGIGAGSSNVIWPTVMNNVLGTKFKVVAGYKSGPELWFAMERGETQGRTGSYKDLYSQRPDWLKQGKVVFPIQLGSFKDKDLPNVPLITEFAKTDEQRRILQVIFSPIALGQPYLAPPNLPADRIATLRASFAATMKDKAFLDEARKREFDIEPLTGEQVTQSIREAFSHPPAIIAKAKAAMKTR